MDQAVAARRRLGAVVGPVRLVPTSSITTQIGGLNSYFGAVEVGSASDGLVVVNRLPLERYLLGLNEVPPDWPTEALEAQAIAARTYALETLGRPPAGAAAVYGFDICASVECQVFSGADVLKVADGGRWRDAVEATSGTAVLHEGRPILARYHSTSGGTTFDNEQIFPSEGAYPYLKGVESTTEEGSPLYRWRVSFALRKLERMVRRAGFWEGRRRLEIVRTVDSSQGLHYPDVLLESGRHRVRITAEELRVELRDIAPSLYPALYPSAWHTTSGRLPETFPSNRLTIATSGRTVRVVGRGWGHGVGMSQWGAEGLAKRGATAEEILLHYYSGVEVGPVDARGPIRVGVAWGLGEVTATGSFRLLDGTGRVLVDDAVGTWRFVSEGPGAVSVDPPKGFGLPLEVGIVAGPDTVEVGKRITFDVALSRPARVRVVVEGASAGPLEVRSAGRSKLAWRAPREPGEYEVSIRAQAGGRTRKDGTTLRVEAPAAAEAERPVPPPERDGGPPWSLVLGVAGTVLLIAALFGAIKATMGR